MTPSEVKATLSFSDGSPSVELPIYKGTVVRIGLMGERRSVHSNHTF